METSFLEHDLVYLLSGDLVSSVPALGVQLLSLMINASRQINLGHSYTGEPPAG